MTTIQIKPVTKKLNYLTISSVKVNLDNSAQIIGYITDGTLSDGYSLFMDAETYAGWGDDDNYVIDWVMKELGLSYPTK